MEENDKPEPESPENESPQPEEEREPDKTEESKDVGRFWRELKQRKVYQVAGAYAVTAWITIQVMASTFGNFNIPSWVFRMVVVWLVVGFPFAITIAWVVETSEDWKKRRVWMVSGSGMALLLVITLIFWQPWSSPLPTETVAEESAEMQQVRTILSSLELIPEDLVLADHMMEVILEKDPLNTDAIILMAHVQVTFLYRGFELSDERIDKARQFSERAVSLAPENPHALTAMGIFLYTAYRDEKGAFELVDRAAKLVPDDAFIHRWRAEIFRRNEMLSTEEAVQLMLDTYERFPDDALMLYNIARYYRNEYNYPKMEEFLNRTVKVAPIVNAYLWKAILAFNLRGELEPLKEIYEKVPSRMRSQERFLYHDWLYAMAKRDPQYGLSALRQTTEVWFTDFIYQGPRQLLEAQLHDLEGKTELADIKYEAALEELRQNRDQSPRGLLNYYIMQTWIYLGLGNMEEAQKSYTIMLQSLPRPARIASHGVDWFDPLMLTLLMDDKEVTIAVIKEATGRSEHEETVDEPSAQNIRTFLRNQFRYDPRIERWKDDPEIRALIEEPR